MNRLPEIRNGSVVPYVGLPYPNGFECCWAGEFSSPGASIPPLICLGSVDGKLLFTDQEFEKTIASDKPRSVSGEAINGVASLESWVAVSTRMEVSFWSATKNECISLPHGTHGVSRSPNGYFLAPLGKDGILTANPSTDHVSLTAHKPGDGNQYIYRVLSLRSQPGTEVLACAARRNGIVAGIFSASQKITSMRSAHFDGLDIVDVCPLSPEIDSLGVAALGRDGSVILCRDVLNDTKTMTFKFENLNGVAYRILSQRGDIYVLTSRGLFVLGSLAGRFVSGESMERVTTPVMPLATKAIDMNLAWGRWLLVVLTNAVIRFDVNLIHDFVPRNIRYGEIQELRSIAPAMESEWADIYSTTASLAAAN